MATSEDLQRLLNLLSEDVTLLAEFSPALRNDSNFMLEAVKLNPRSLMYGGPDVRSCKAVVSAALHQLQQQQQKEKEEKEEEGNEAELPILRWASEALRDDEEVALWAMRVSDPSASSVMSDRLKTDDAFHAACLSCIALPGDPDAVLLDLAFEQVLGDEDNLAAGSGSGSDNCHLYSDASAHVGVGVDVGVVENVDPHEGQALRGLRCIATMLSGCHFHLDLSAQATVGELADRLRVTLEAEAKAKVGQRLVLVLQREGRPLSPLEAGLSLSTCA